MSGSVCPGSPLRFFQTSCGSVRFLTGQTTFSRFCSRSDKHAAVLRLQNTQPKDRRVYTALTGILTEPQDVWKNRRGEPGQTEPLTQFFYLRPDRRTFPL
ncbi:hypothetical protein F240042I4_15430 [Eisenbergiella tayi]